MNVYGISCFANTNIFYCTDDMVARYAAGPINGAKKYVIEEVA